MLSERRRELVKRFIRNMGASTMYLDDAQLKERAAFLVRMHKGRGVL